METTHGQVQLLTTWAGRQRVRSTDGFRPYTDDDSETNDPLGTLYRLVCGRVPDEGGDWRDQEVDWILGK